MSATKIEWTQETWNPTVGCDRVSPGCDNCYAIGQAHRFAFAEQRSLTERRDGRVDWTGHVALHPERLTAPLRWRKPRRVFVDSMSDLFHDQVPDGFIGSVFEMMAKTPQHTYQILTKRPGRMRSLLNRWAAEGARHDWAGPGTAVFRRDDMCWVGPVTWPLPNVWLGCSVEDQKRADLRISALLDTPAAVRFLSCEPLLGPVDLSRWIYGKAWPDTTCGAGGIGGHAITMEPGPIGWVIAGGESGPRARPMHPAWARQLRDDCQAAGVPFFFKQWGEWAPTGAIGMGGDSRSMFVGPQIDEPGFREEIQRMGKKAAGRELDGRTWDEYPAVTP